MLPGADLAAVGGEVDPLQQGLRVGAVLRVHGHPDGGVHVEGEVPKTISPRICSRSSAASCSASSALSSRSVTTNSSPPTRPTRADEGALRRSRLATSARTLSPAACPSDSLT